MKFGIFDWVEASDTLSPARGLRAQAASSPRRPTSAGFHGMFLAEHQGTPLSIDGSPSVLLSAMFQRTRRLRAGALTFCLPWYDPYRFYNEVCMLDQLSGGRLELGVGRGVSPIESLIFGLKSIDESRERYRETLDVFFAACATRRCSTSRASYYEYQDVELYIKPVQRPYPPLWFPSSNKDSIEFTARHGYHTALIGEARRTASRCSAQYREVWQKHRTTRAATTRTSRAPFLAKTQHLVIAETDIEAESIGLQAYETWTSHIHHLTRKARPARRAQDSTPYDEDSRAAPDRRLAAHRAGKGAGGARRHRRELPAVHLLVRQPRRRRPRCARSSCSRAR